MSSAGISTPSTVSAGGHDVGDVDDPGVEVAGLDLGQQRPDVGFVGVDRRGDPGVGQRLAAELAAGHLLGAQPDEQVGVGEVVQPGDAGRVAGRDRDLEQVGHEVLGIAGRPRRRRPGPCSRCWPRRRRRPGRRRGSAPGGPTMPEVELDGHVRVLRLERGPELRERVGQRGGCEHRDVALERRLLGRRLRRRRAGIVVIVVAAGGEHQGGHAGDGEQPQHGASWFLQTRYTLVVTVNLSVATWATAVATSRRGTSPHALAQRVGRPGRARRGAPPRLRHRRGAPGRHARRRRLAPHPPARLPRARAPRGAGPRRAPPHRAQHRRTAPHRLWPHRPWPHGPPPWLVTPVGHIRDVRNAFLLKLVITEQLGLEPADLIEAQRWAFADLLDQRAIEPPRTDHVAMWRHHSAAAVAAFLDALSKPRT